MINWSYSSLKDFLNCPKQYYHVKVAKDFVKKDTVHTLYGKEVHKALEDYVRDGTPLAKNYQIYQKVLDELVAIPGDKYPEFRMALAPDRTKCDFDDESRWVRGIVDLLIVDNEDAYIVDYKTGNNKYADPKQLRLMALMTYAHFPSVQRIKAGLLFILRNSFVNEEYTRKDMDRLWADFLPSIARLELSYKSNMWNPQPSGLCGWCPVESCKFYKEK